jgi:release factor glutamine methyltransferase
VIARELIEWAERTLKESPAIDHWQRGRERIEAEELLEFLLGDLPDPDDEIPAFGRRKYERLVERRATGEPVPHIKGYVEFRGLRLLARPGVFVPRDSSELLVQQAARRLRGRWDPVAVDVATGSGAIALAVASEVKTAAVFGTDFSPSAVSLARANARRLGLPVRFVRGDLFSSLPRSVAGRVDVVTFHPPYLGRGELRELPDEIRRFEPEEALTDRSPRGMRLIDRAAAEAWDWLRPGGWLLIEVSPDRSRQVAAILRRAGYGDVRTTKAGLEVSRVLTARAGR